MPFFLSLSLHRQFCFLFMFYIWLECEFRLVCQRAKKKWSSCHCSRGGGDDDDNDRNGEKPPTKKEIWSKEMMAAKTIKLKWSSVKLERTSSTTAIAAHCHKTADSAEAVPIVLHDHVIVCVLLWMCLSSVFMRWVGWWDSHSHTHTTLHKIPPLVYCFAHAIHFCNGKICSKHSKK